VRITFALLLWACASPAAADARVRPGDLVFQSSGSTESALIAEVTGSPWTHVGVVFERHSEPWVLEAVSPVRWTRFDRWLARGNGRYLVRRLRVAPTQRQIDALLREGSRYLGRPYDSRFEWSDRRMYCSELAWKMFDRALAIRLSEPQRWRDFELPPAAIALARRRLGHLPPSDAVIITPAALVDSPALVEP
jgi:hypothetical protein